MKQTWKLNLKCLSPLFIGSGDTYNPKQYVYMDNHGSGNIYFLNEGHWANYLFQNNLLDEFTNNFMNYSSIYSFLKRNLGRNESMKSILQDLSQCGVVSGPEPVYYKSKGHERGNVNEVHACIRDAKGTPYIPGSSLKGALRTAIIAEDIRNNPQKYIYCWRHLKKASEINPRDRSANRTYYAEIKEAADELNNLFNENNLRDTKSGSFQNLFRYLEVSDSIHSEHVKTGVVQKYDLTLGNRRNESHPHSISLFRECILPGSEFSFYVSFDPEKLGKSGINGIEDIQRAIDEYMGLQIDIYSIFHETDRYLDSMDKGCLFLGGGTGYISKTLPYELSKAENIDDYDRQINSAVEVVRSIMMRNFRRGKHDRYSDIAPHTLKLTYYGGDYMLMGLCQIEVADRLC